MTPSAHEKWLLIFYSVPSKPVSGRMKLWRKLSRVGAVQFKGAVYILPYSEEHHELFQWLISEVVSMGGDGSFVRTNRVETMDDAEIRALFNRQREKEYRAVERELEVVERKVQSFRKGTRSQEATRLSNELARLKKEFVYLRSIDFFSAPAGDAVGRRIRTLEAGIKEILAVAKDKGPALSISPRRVGDYQGRTWATRKNPFADRMASAWLIRRFIDKNARFHFIDERELGGLGEGFASFDARGAEFTHTGDLCTFEVLVKAFGIKDKAVKKIREVVHELDLKDDKYENAETAGLEEILTGIRKTSRNDADALEKGIAVFELLYASKS